MKLPTPGNGYSRDDQQEIRRQIELADKQNLKRDRDIEMRDARIIIMSPNGTRYAITVSNTGTLSTVAV